MPYIPVMQNIDQEIELLQFEGNYEACQQLQGYILVNLNLLQKWSNTRKRATGRTLSALRRWSVRGTCSLELERETAQEYHVAEQPELTSSTRSAPVSGAPFLTNSTTTPPTWQVYPSYNMEDPPGQRLLFSNFTYAEFMDFQHETSQAIQRERGKRQDPSSSAVPPSSHPSYSTTKLQTYNAAIDIHNVLTGNTS